jgi:hypothetical protein
MFYVHAKFSRKRMKIKEVEAYWRFARILDREAKKFATDRGGVLGFQHIALIQKIPATT